jgi:catechol 2,3-dioxygenase
MQRTKPLIKTLSALKLGSIVLNVKDLAKMKDFYHIGMGLDVIKQAPTQIILGKEKKPLITLSHTMHLDVTDPTHAGLYHFAILFSSRGDLARMVYRILKKHPEKFSGSADHLVSEAFYFNDPEGNGIELYFDRDRSEWQWENNQVKMATIYLDPKKYLQKYIVLEEKNREIKMGHFHLKVGDLAKARNFYVDILGFDITAKLPGALFISVAGYHHHLGLNTWESLGAPLRDQSLGLEQLEFILKNQNDLQLLRDQLEKNAILFEDKSNSLLFHDPWNNKILAKIES